MKDCPRTLSIRSGARWRITVCTSLDRSPKLEESLLWIYKSHQRVEQQVATVLRVLERRLASVETSAVPIEESFRTLLDRIISVTRGLFPAVSDLAREVRYRAFERPLFERARQKVYDEVEEHLAYLERHPEAPDRATRESAHCSIARKLLARSFIRRFAAVSRGICVNSCWKCSPAGITGFERFKCSEASNGGRCGIIGRIRSHGKRIHLFTTYAGYPQITRRRGQCFS